MTAISYAPKLSEVDITCEVTDEEINVLRILVKDAAENLYSFELLENVGCDKDTLVHLDDKEILAGCATDVKGQNGLYAVTRLHDVDTSHYCGVASSVIKEFSIVTQDHASKDPGEVVADQVDLVRIIYEDKQGILYHVEIEYKIERDLDNILNLCRTKLAELITALNKSGKPELIAEVGDSTAYSKVAVRFVAEHSIVLREEWEFLDSQALADFRSASRCCLGKPSE